MLRVRALDLLIRRMLDQSTYLLKSIWSVEEQKRSIDNNPFVKWNIPVLHREWAGGFLCRLSVFYFMERAIGLEPTTVCLEGRDSTN